jgi:hypothetical protein
MVVVIDRFAFGRPAFMQSIPVLGAGQWTLTALLLLSAAAFVRGILLLAPGGRRLSELPAWSRNDRWGAFAGIATHVVFVALFLAAPALFNTLVMEDQPVENASALLWFIAGALTLLAALRLHRQPDYARGPFWLLLGSSALFILCGMEEVSWFQRVLHIETPAAVERVNMQGELNLHNLSTHPTENVFYNGMVVLLVIVPALCALNVIRLERWDLGVAIPRPYLVVIGVLTTAWNFSKWNIPLFQLSLFISVLLTAVLAMRMSNSPSRALLLTAAGATIAGQAIFLIFGENFIRDWDVSEYREMFIPMGCFMWSCNVFAATKAFAAKPPLRPSGLAATAATTLRVVNK